MVRTLIVGAALAASIPVGAQDSPAPRFDVVSVKPNVSSDPRQSFGGAPGRVIGENVPVWWLIRAAFGIQEFQLVGAPDWLFSDRYDIVATMAATRAPAEVRMMMRAMLADRFSLVTRDDTREMAVYALTAASASRILGPRLIPSAIRDCEAVRGTPERCGINVNSGRVKATGIPIAELAPLLQQYVGRPVVDKTGLEGRFDFELQFTPELEAGGDRSDDISLFTALREQLGLTLQSERGFATVLIIERVMRPSAD
jgi:uncharacterized protein (TIGR03435 family)